MPAISVVPALAGMCSTIASSVSLLIIWLIIGSASTTPTTVVIAPAVLRSSSPRPSVNSARPAM